MNKQGQLILVGMPLGNDRDISERALKTLAMADLILAEDTRITSLFLGQHGLSASLLSYHQHNEASREETIITHLHEGKTIALVTDAGMPAISDPGTRLVRAVVEAGFLVRAVPGPSAGITALALSGLDSRRFLFEGFLAPKGAERASRLDYIASFPHTVILYEAPHRLLKTLVDLAERDLHRRELAIGRELTKRYEEVIYTTLEEAISRFEKSPIRGEFVLVLEGQDAFQARCPEDLDSERRVLLMETFARERLALGDHKTTVRKALEAQFGLARNAAYDLVLALDDHSDVLE